MSAASATLLTNIGVVPHSDAQGSHCLSSGSVLAERIARNIHLRSARLRGSLRLHPPIQASASAPSVSGEPAPIIESVASSAACLAFPPGKPPLRCIP